MNKVPLILGILIIILGFFILPPIAEFIFGGYVCGHNNMYLVSFAIILIGIYLLIKDKK
jgi:hypothetical protein